MIFEAHPPPSCSPVSAGCERCGAISAEPPNPNLPDVQGRLVTDIYLNGCLRLNTTLPNRRLGNNAYMFLHGFIYLISML